MKKTDDIEHSRGCGADRTLIHCWQEGNVTESLGKSPAVSNEVNQTSTLSSSNSIPKYLHKSNVDICPQKDWNMKVYIKFIHDGPKLETIQIPINWRMVVEHLYNRMGTAIKEK